MKHVQAPAPVTDTLVHPWVFLAGAIDLDRAERWQDRVVASFADLAGTILNPRRDDWDATWQQDLDDPRFAEQVAWELDAMDRADIIACWLPAGSQAPVSMLELGLHARSKRLVVGCPPGFHRRGNVQAVCNRYGITSCDDFPAMLQAIRDRLTGG